MVEKLAKIAVGVDIIEIQRIQKAASKSRGSFLKRIYTNAELENSNNNSSSLAALFAAKEAVMKALGTGTKGIGWKEIEVLSNNDGAPIVQLSGKAANKARDIGISQFAVSISHSKEYAIAMVVGYAG
jgi:holo-[acyl-carrier protein] synthase